MEEPQPTASRNGSPKRSEKIRAKRSSGEKQVVPAFHVTWGPRLDVDPKAGKLFRVTPPEEM